MTFNTSANMLKPKKQVTNATAIKGSRRHADFSKLLLAGLSAILFFVIEKLDCQPYRIIESFLCGIGILFCGIAILGYLKTADKLEEEKEILEARNKDISTWMSKKIDKDQTNSLNFSISLVCLAVCTIIFLLNPMLCPSNNKNNQPKTINNYSFQSFPDTLNKQATHTRPCKANCKKSIENSTCQCKY